MPVGRIPVAASPATRSRVQVLPFWGSLVLMLRIPSWVRLDGVALLERDPSVAGLVTGGSRRLRRSALQPCFGTGRVPVPGVRLGRLAERVPEKRLPVVLGLAAVRANALQRGTRDPRGWPE